MKNVLRQAMIFIFLITLLSCSKQPNKDDIELEKQFSTAVPLSDMNKSLQVIVDSKDTSFKFGSDIGLIIYNKSSNPIYFDEDSHVRLLGSIDNLQWLEVKNALTYSGPMLLSPQGTPLLDLAYTWVKPLRAQTNLETEDQNILLRIVIVGEIMDGDTRTGQNVGAYVDVTVQP